MQKEKRNWKEQSKAASVYSSGNYSPHLAITYNGKEPKKNILNTYTISSLQEPSSCELSKRRTCFPSMSGVSDTAACPPSHTADDPSALPPPTSSPSSSQYLFLPVHAMPAAVLHYCNFQSTVLYDENCFIFCGFLKCTICVKSIINLLQYSTI